MDIGIVIPVVISLAVIVWTIESPSKQMNGLKKYRSESMNVLHDALNAKEICQQDYGSYTKELFRRYDHFDKAIRRLTWIKRFLPVLLAIEVLHITLHFYQWYWQFEQLLPGLNNCFLIIIELFILFYFLIKEIQFSDAKIFAYQNYCWAFVAKYKYNMDAYSP